jgi:hypothetical protein
MLLTKENIEKAGFVRKSQTVWTKGNWYYCRCPSCFRFSDKQKQQEHRTEHQCRYCNLKISFSSKSVKLGLRDGIKDE